MQITDVKVFIKEENSLLAFANVIFDNVFLVKGFRVIKGVEGEPWVAMPSKKNKNGDYADSAYPINDKFRNNLTEKVLAAYEVEKSKFDVKNKG